MEKTNNTTGWVITSAALAVNLIMGLLYAWSVFKKALVADWGWTNATASLPFTVSAAVFSIVMIFAGRAQDKIGPRYIAMLGGLMLGLGLILSGFTTNPAVMVLTFGVIGATGIGLGYSATTPCAIKWFEASKKGLISGIVVSGVGLAPVYMAPLTNYLIKSYGIQQTFIILGIIAIGAVAIFSLALKNPPADYIPKANVNTNKTTTVAIQYPWTEMTKTPQFYLLWLMFLLSATAGLMLLGHLASIAADQAGWQAGFVLVVILSIFNAGGRVVGGILSDKIGRTSAMMLVFTIQAINMFLFNFYTTIPLLVIGAAVAGMSYGALFSLFPSTTADFFGLKNLGVNYGLVFTGWGTAGVIGPILGGLVKDITGTYSISYIVAGVLLSIGVVMVKTIKAPAKKQAEL
jgi:OFA family oxalate/formate antiporter-like MFS transporter